MKVAFLILLSSLFVASAAFAVIPDEVVLGTPRMGEVLFSHPVHRGVGVCADCHHKGVEAGACRACHGVDKDIPNMKIASHEMCKGCHKKTGAPTGCVECHLQETRVKTKPETRHSKPPVQIKAR